jgi:hypothetical protein
MPVEVEVDGKVVTVPMRGGKGVLRLPGPRAHVVLDPRSRVLRYNPAIEAWQKQEEERRKEAAAVKPKA